MICNRTSWIRFLFATCMTLGMIHSPIDIFGQQLGFLSPDTLKKLSIEELMNLEVISVSRRAEKLTKAASAIQVITSEDMYRSGATSIPEALRLAINLHVAQKNSHDWAISARGFNTDLANKMLVLIDGRTVYTPLFSGVFWDRQDYLLEDIDRIEIISGPGGTLWGSNAVNGVINIITKNSRDTQGLYVEAGGGTQVRDFIGLRYGGTMGATGSYRVYGKYFDRDDAVYPDGSDASDSWRMGQSGFRMETQLTEKNSLTLQGDYYAGQLNLSTGGASRVWGGNVLGRWTHEFSDHSVMDLQVYYDRTSLSQPVPESRTEDNSIQLAPAGTLKDDLDTYDIDFQHSVGFGDHNNMVWGLGFRNMHDVVVSAPGLAFSPPTLNRNLFSGFIQDEIALTKKLSFTAGIKIEHNDYTGFEFEPNTRLQFTLASNQTLWAATSRAVRIPSRVDRHIRLATPGFSPLIDNLLIGGENFDSETVVAYELGYRTQLESKVSGSLSLFYNVYDKIRSTSPSPPPALFGLPLFYENNLEGETYGVELSITYQVFDWWRIRSGYALLKEEIRIKQGKTDFNNALNETADPRNRFLLHTSLNLSKQIGLDGDLRIIDSFLYNESGVAERMPAYTELDLRLVWHITKRFDFSVVGQNILHNHHPEYVISNPNPPEEIERSVYGKITWRY